VWDEISFVKPADTSTEELNRTYVYEKDKVKRKLIIMKKRLQDMFGYKYPVQRRVMEERVEKLQSKFYDFDYLLNPYHILPGLLLDIDITSIKRKKATLDGMANVLNEFLYGVSKGFQDAAFASFSRRRSTVRQDLNQSFAAEEQPEDKGQSYLDLLNSSMAEEAPAKALSAPKEAEKKSTGVVDNSKRKTQQKPQKRSAGSKLTTI